MQSEDNPDSVRDKLVAFRHRPGDDEIPGMPGWTIEALRKALKEGEESGIAEDFDIDAFIEAIRD